MSWVLVLVLIHTTSADTFAVRGFRTQAECEQIGRAWLAEVHRREGDSDISLYRCERHEKTPN